MQSLLYSRRCLVVMQLADDGLEDQLQDYELSEEED